MLQRLWTFALPLRLLGRIDRRRRGVDADRRVEWLSGAALCLSRQTFDAVGGFDERFHMYGEDVEWQRRLAAAGISRVLHEDICIRHDVGHGVERDSQALDRRFIQFWQGELIDTRLTSGTKAVAVLRIGLAPISILNLPFAALRKLLPAAHGSHSGVSPSVYLRVPWLTTQPKRKAR